jgi:predicted HicB family RNase H-like nuclease
MKNHLEYKGYSGSVDFNATDNILFGKIVGISDTVTFEGSSIKELTEAFHEAVDDYLDTCKELGKTAERKF